MPVWGPSISGILLDWLQICQNNAIRKIYSREYASENVHTMGLMNRHRILNVKNNIFVESSILHYKIIKGMPKIRNNFVIHAQNHDYLTRNRNNAITQLYRTNIGRDSVLRQSVASFNQIPVNIL